VFLEACWMLRRACHRMGSAPINGWRAAAAWRRFWRSYRGFREIASVEWQPALRFLYPCLGDDTGATEIEPIYFYQDAWAFERIVAARPSFHVDVGSHHKYVALLSRVLPVTMVDIRPLSLRLDGLAFTPGSILSLPYRDASVPSLSSLCVIEHIGLGRYGDPLDSEGHLRAIAELKRVIAPGGDLYISLPVREGNRLYFNAHRALDETQLLPLFAPFQVVDRAYVCDKTFGRERTTSEAVGCYHLRRPA
jgi:SAM-dependent methyltransferase